MLKPLQNIKSPFLVKKKKTEKKSVFSLLRFLTAFKIYLPVRSELYHPFVIPLLLLFFLLTFFYQQYCLFPFETKWFKTKRFIFLTFQEKQQKNVFAWTHHFSFHANEKGILKKKLLLFLQLTFPFLSTCKVNERQHFLLPPPPFFVNARNCQHHSGWGGITMISLVNWFYGNIL